jgi:hypothetical protein
MAEVTKRTVSTDALETLGTIIDDKQKRDAIHLAVLPVMAGARLKPGQEIALTDGLALPHAGGMLIVDPFLREPAMPGDRFWAVLKPRLVTSLRHVWTHPALPSEEIESAAPAGDFDLEKAKARAVIESIAERCNVDSADELICGARSYLKRGDYKCEGGRWEGVSLPEDEFWPAYEIVTGEKVDDSKRDSFFSCSC